MNDTPENCLAHAAIARAAAEGTMLDNVRRKHLESAVAWENLANILRGDIGEREAFASSQVTNSAAAAQPAPTVQGSDGTEGEGPGN